ncbi:MAG: hypothetical protein ACM3YN_09930 [Parcubacteria group bacterium]
MVKWMKWAPSLAALVVAHPAAAQPLVDAVKAGKPILEMRARYEGVDQAGFPDTAEAETLRTRLGWETGAWHGLKGLVEFEDVRAAGDYNDAVPPAEPYPVIPDPEVTELNRAQLTWTPAPTATVTLGRQRIVLDDQRFVGNSGWRQDELTVDAARADFKLGKLALTGAWLGHINRVYGEALDWKSDSWLAHATYPVSDLLNLTGFVYALEFDNAAAQSSLTSGVRVTGKAPVGPLTLAYAASYAHQSDYRNNPDDFGLDYTDAELAATFGQLTLKGAWERLEGDGVHGFSTPLGTLHAFQGWADALTATPANGIDDKNLTLTWKPVLPLKGVELTARRHDFETERTGASLGHEWDLLAQAPFTKNLTGVVKWADYDGVAGFTSRRKLWVSLEFKL